MAAPGAGKAICDKCFASVVPGAGFCPECGAPLGGDATAAEGSDAAIYPELARANLHRMRNEWKAAEDVCLGILKRYPNNMTANALLGDISAERGDLEHAVQWYELALDLIPDSPAVKEKLNSVRQRMKEREAASAAEQIGIPPPKPGPSPVLIGVALVILLLVGIGAFALGRRTERPVVRAPIEFGAQEAPPAADASEPAPAQDEPPPVTTQEGAWRDVALFDSLSRSMPEGTRLLDAWQDPRSLQVLVTFDVGQSNARALGARVGSSALEKLPSAQAVTVRGVKDNQLVLVADVTRQAVMQTSTAEWQMQHGTDAEAWTNAVLTNVWAPGQETPPTPSTQ